MLSLQLNDFALSGAAEEQQKSTNTADGDVCVNG